MFYELCKIIISIFAFVCYILIYVKTRQKLNQILAENTGQSIERIEIDTERDNFMSAQEAKEYGLVDEVITSH